MRYLHRRRSHAACPTLISHLRVNPPPRVFTPRHASGNCRRKRGVRFSKRPKPVMITHARSFVHQRCRGLRDTAVEDDDPTRWVVAHRRQLRRQYPRNRTPRSNRPRRQRQRQQWRETRIRIRYPRRGTWIRSSPCSMPGARVSSPALTTRRGPSTWRRTSNLTRRRRLAFTPFSRRMRATPASKRRENGHMHPNLRHPNSQ